MSARNSRRPCADDDCQGTALQRRRWCTWHWLPRQPIPVQEAWAQSRRDHPQAKPDKAFFETYTAWRWCAGCSWVVPKDYCTGSRCKACSRAATRASHVRRTYGLDPAELEALQRWQGGRCFICGRGVVKRQLAVDHDHKTGLVRGLLCSDDQHGCNVLARRFLDDAKAAERLLAYVQATPMQRMRNGDAPWQF